MRWRFFVAAATCAAAASATHVSVNLSAAADGLVYDGHGALSAGASSRLLYDYDEPQRSQVLDYLFKPKFGASLHLVKVEIGGDSQSTDGTEASHMHYRDDLNCNRGYEFWLLEEARKRNPKIATFALSWAVPEWVGNDTYFSQDNIDYHVRWLKCVRDKHPTVGNIDYMGVWNERPWGTPDWNKEFRTAMDAEGFGNTRIIMPDGAFSNEILKDMDSDPAFKAAVDGIGLHYPCNNPQPEVQAKYGLKYWSSEDFSTVADWAGGGCWGRLLNQNYVRMNMTSTISWSLVWSVYDDWPYFGNGLMYAMHPWSGYYEVNSPIWTSAHTEQFTEVGWRYVPGGSGYLEKGGSYVTLASANGSDVTVVLEKLEGKCLRCAGQTTEAETVTIHIAGGARGHASLAHWRTNQTHEFVEAEKVAVGPDGTCRVSVPKDGIVTVSTVMDAAHGSFAVPIPARAEFPLPYSDSFEGRPVGGFPKYLSDNGGSFEIVDGPAGRGHVLSQMVHPPPVKNSWGRNVEPITVAGEKTWEDINVSADVILPNATPPQRVSGNLRSAYSGLCFDVRGKGGAGTEVDTWTCVADYNEQFTYTAAGELVESRTGLCVTTGRCGAADVCVQACDGGDGQRWSVDVSGSSAVKHRSSGKCVRTTGNALNSPLKLGACTGASDAVWTFDRYASGHYAGVCARVVGGGGGQKGPSLCLQLFADGSWAVGDRTKQTKLANGTIGGPAVGAWHSLSLSVEAGRAAAVVDGAVVASGIESGAGAGRVALVSGWNEANYDNFAVRKP